MEKGTNNNTNYALRYIGEKRLQEIETTKRKHNF